MKINVKNLTGLRLDYLDATKDIILALGERQGAYDSMCPRYNLNDKERAERLKELATATKKVNAACDVQREVEKAAGYKLGVFALIKHDVANPIRCALAVLVSKAFTAAMVPETRNVGYLAAYAGGAEPSDLLVIRESFRYPDGILRAHIHAEVGRVLDELGSLTLKERSLRLLLGMEPVDSEFDWLDAHPIRGTGRR